jgi:type IV secretory pathway TrbD component
LLMGVPILLVTTSLKWAAGQVARPILIIAALGLFIWAVPTEPLVRTFYRDDPALVEKMIYQQQHPGDKAAAAEVQRLLQARHNR